MNVLPSQKLTISQVFLGLAAGLMLFLLPMTTTLAVFQRA